MENQIETVIIGGGQAGLALSYLLRQQEIEHVILEQAEQAAHSWRNQRWDSFTFVTPNWTIQLPGAEYHGDDPDGFMTRNKIIAYFENYAAQYKLPVQYNTRVTSVEKNEQGYAVKTDHATFNAVNVVMATGSFQQSKIPSFSTRISKEIVQIGSAEYRNPAQLPPGAVLVVGSAQSGGQIAEELYESGRTVYLGVGSAGRIPRRYRGKDTVWWLNQVGFFDQTVDRLQSPKERFAGNPQATGKNGGHTINLHQFARDGVVLLGHLQDAEDTKIIIAPNLKETLTKVDAFEANVVKLIDDHIARIGLAAPTEILPQLRDGYSADVITELDLQSAGISTIIWAIGFKFDFSLVQLPIGDSDGYPIQKRGVTDYAGLYFLGLHWLHKRRSGILLGVGEDAAYIASHIANRKVTNA